MILRQVVLLPLAFAFALWRECDTRPSSASGHSRALAAEDTIRGIVAVAGTSFEKQVVVRVSADRRIRIVGRLADMIGRTAGTDVWIAGTRLPDGFEAERFIVRSVDGQPAIDGILQRDGRDLVIVSNGQRTRIANPPADFMGREGARVWVTGRLDVGAITYGFIDPPR